MLSPHIQQPQRKSFLSPESLKTFKPVQSPKFDKQKALEDQARRKLVYEQKMAQYDQYNSMLSAKAKKEIDIVKAQLDDENRGIIGFTQSPQHVKPPHPLSHKPSKSLFPYPPKPQPRHSPCSQPNLEQLRTKNRTLQTRNIQLKSYLKEINTGVSQLECILQEVQMTYNSLKPPNPEFKGLWLFDQGQDDQKDFVVSEHNTKDTVDFEYERNMGLNRAKPNDSGVGMSKESMDCTISTSHQRLQAIEILEQKFNKILQTISRRQFDSQKISTQLKELNEIEKQLDSLKRSSVKPILIFSKSHKSIQLPFSTEKGQEYHSKVNNLNKVKSMDRIIA